jgi:nucleoside-diphosphate-sugar epimerase
VIGAGNVAKACEHHGIGKLIFVSSPSVYFNGKDRIGVSEAEPLPPKQLTHYGKTKLIAETELAALLDKGLKVMIFRPRAVHGPHDGTILPRILSMAEKGSFPLINDGSALVDITYVDNFVGAVGKALSADDDAWNETYNITNGDPISVRDWFSSVLAIFDKPFRPKNIPEPLAKAIALVMEAAGLLPFGPDEPSMTRFSVGYMAKSMTLSIEKARRKLGYVPSVGNREGFERYAAWRRKQAQNEM